MTVMISSPLLSQILYALSILFLFLVYGAIVRRGIVSGRAIIGVGVLIGAVAVAASYLNVPAPVRRDAPLPLLLFAPGLMAVCAAVCVAFAYRAQQVVDLATFEIGDTRIVVRYAPASRIQADALLLPTTTTLRMLSGAAGAVHVAGGAAIEKEARPFAPVGIGKVVSTAGGRLLVDRILHVAVHEPLRAAEEASLRRGLENAAQQARKARAETIAIPLGALRGLPASTVAAAAAEALLKQRRAFSEIVFVVLERRNTVPVREAVARVVSAAIPAPR
jgi:O-acetyl-ADP-ribose deacetylase (regulator of RNase III)